MHFKGVHVGKIIETQEDLIAHSYPLLIAPKPAPVAAKAEKPAEKPAAKPEKKSESKKSEKKAEAKKEKEEAPVSKKDAIPPPPPAPPPVEDTEIDFAVPVEVAGSEDQTKV